MAFTNPQKLAMRRIFGPLIAKRLIDSTNDDLDSFLGLLDPVVGTDTYVKSKIQDAKNALLSEKAQLIPNANARSAQIDVETGVLDSLLALYP